MTAAVRARTAAALLLLASATAAAAPAAAQAGSAQADLSQTIRFPVYDPRLGSLEGYRAALYEAVDRHIAHIQAGEIRPYEVAPVEVIPGQTRTGPEAWSNPSEPCRPASSDAAPWPRASEQLPSCHPPPGAKARKQGCAANARAPYTPCAAALVGARLAGYYCCQRGRPSLQRRA